MFIKEALQGLGILIGYLVSVVGSLLLVRRFVGIPSEVTRKTLHMTIAFSVFVWLYAFRTWYVSAISAAALTALLYPLLSLAERLPIYRRFLAERRGGEVKKSMVSAFSMMVVLIAVYWGYFGEGSKYVIVAAIMAWGFGDAAAALVGMNYGRHFVKNRFVEGKKTLEGAVSMYAMSVLAIFLTTFLYTKKPWFVCLILALLTAPYSALVELFTKQGMDTITVPLAVATAVSVFTMILDRLGM